MSVSTFQQPLYAKTVKGDEQIIVLAVIDDAGAKGIKYLVMHNDVGHEYEGKSLIMLRTDVRFEHFYWPEVEPSDLTEHDHPQEPALHMWIEEHQ